MNWSETDINYLVDNFRKMRIDEIASKLNRTYSAVAQKKMELNLKRNSEEYTDVNDSSETKPHIRTTYRQKRRKRELNQRRAVIIPLIVGCANRLILNCDFILQRYYADQSTKTISSTL
jgi:hypothetical protein